MKEMCEKSTAALCYCLITLSPLICGDQGVNKAQSAEEALKYLLNRTVGGKQKGRPEKQPLVPLFVVLKAFFFI